MYEIEVSTSEEFPVPENLIRETLIATLQAEQVSQANIVVACVDDATIHVVNREHLNHDYPTDVISFLYEESSESGERALDGELIVSMETAIRQAGVYGWNPLDELRLYLVHGLLHLCGYDDHDAAERKEMRGRERSILQKWDLTPHYDEEVL